MIDYSSSIEDCFSENASLHIVTEALGLVLTGLEEEVNSSMRRRSVGRPCEKEQIAFLLEDRFSVKDILLLVGCSKRTIVRKMHEFNLSSRSFTNISNNDLGEKVMEIVTLFPHCGEKLTQARLRSQGIKVTRARIREFIRRVDPSGVHERMSRVLRRQAYHVSSLNSLWHIDTYHKLITL